jgi:hypothetical protein
MSGRTRHGNPGVVAAGNESVEKIQRQILTGRVAM